jgi:hypothetical protein
MAVLLEGKRTSPVASSDGYLRRKARIGVLEDSTIQGSGQTDADGLTLDITAQESRARQPAGAVERVGLGLCWCSRAVRMKNTEALSNTEGAWPQLTSTILIAESQVSESLAPPAERRLKTMGRDKILGIILISLSVLMAPGFGLLLFREGSFHLIILAAPAVIFLVGLLFLFTDLLETSLGIRDEIKELPKLLEDDVEALVHGSLKWTHIIVVATIVTAIMLSGILIWYRKWEASWGPVNIFVVSAVMVAIALVVGIRSQWFQVRRRRTRWWAFLIPLAGLILSVGLGLYSTEPKEFGRQTRTNGFPSEADRWSANRASQITILGIEIGDNLDMDIDCDGEECLLLLLILVAIVCVVASAFIPHFWVLAGHLLLTIMALIALRELLVSERVQEA